MSRLRWTLAGSLGLTWGVFSRGRARVCCACIVPTHGRSARDQERPAVTILAENDYLVVVKGADERSELLYKPDGYHDLKMVGHRRC